jgi:peptide/nickel transport system substrate-binding protein
MSRRSIIGTVAVATVLLLAALTPASAQTPAPAGEIAVSFHVTLAPSWFDPSTAPPQITPFGVLYAIHDALVRPLPGQKMAPSLAESWTESADRLRRDIVRRGQALAIRVDCRG